MGASLLALVVLGTLCVTRHAPALALARAPVPLQVAPPSPTPPVPPPVHIEVPPAAPAEVRVQAALDRLLAHGRIEFETGSDRLRPGAAPLLDAIATELASSPELAVEVEGHTGGRGDAAANRRLSQQRAQAVKAYLASRGMAPDRIHTLGSGSARPLVRSKGPEADEVNRRIEFRILAKGAP